MSSPYEAWADSFHFSEDLKALEQLYYEQHQADLRHQLASLDVESAVRTSLNESVTDLNNETIIEALSQRIAQRLESLLMPVTDAPEHARELAKLKRDNAILARQVQELRSRLIGAEQEVQFLQGLERQYRPLFGSLYLKTL